MTNVDVIKVAKAIIDVVDGMEVLERRIYIFGKALFVITKTVSKFINSPKKAAKENSAQDHLRRIKLMIKSKFMATKIKLSEVGFKFFMKVLIFMLGVIIKILDIQIIGNGSMLRTAIIFFYFFSEGISLLEKARNMGLPFLAKLKSMLEQLHDRSGEDKDA